MDGYLRKPEDLGFSIQGIRSWFKGWPAFAKVDKIQEKCGLTMVARDLRLVKPICLHLPLPDIGLHITALPGLTGSCKVKCRDRFN